MAKSIAYNNIFFNEGEESKIKEILCFDSLKFSCYLYLHKLCDGKSDCNKCQDFKKMSHGDIEIMINKEE